MCFRGKKHKICHYLLNPHFGSLFYIFLQFFSRVNHVNLALFREADIKFDKFPVPLLHFLKLCISCRSTGFTTNSTMTDTWTKFMHCTLDSIIALCLGVTTYSKTTNKSQQGGKRWRWIGNERDTCLQRETWKTARWLY